MKSVTFKSGYKYQLTKTYILPNISIKPKKDIITEYIELTTNGQLTIREGYAWDGPSGPTIDTKDFMRGSLVHDALYQLMREKHLDVKKDREAADKLLQEICIKDGMPSWRAWWVYQGVRLFGEPSAEPKNGNREKQAP